MSSLDWILIAGLAVCVVLALRTFYRRRKQGGGCCGCCETCGQCGAREDASPAEKHSASLPVKKRPR